MKKPPVHYRPAGVDPTLDDIPPRRASLKPLLGCIVPFVLLCVAVFGFTAALSYQQGRAAAGGAVLPTLLVVTEETTSELKATDSPTPDSELIYSVIGTPGNTPIIPTELHYIPPSATITDTALPTITPTYTATQKIQVMKVTQVIYVTQPWTPKPPQIIQVTSPPIVVTHPVYVLVTATPVSYTMIPVTALASFTPTNDDIVPNISPGPIWTDTPTVTNSPTPTATPTQTETMTFDNYPMPTLDKTPVLSSPTGTIKITQTHTPTPAGETTQEATP